MALKGHITEQKVFALIKKQNGHGARVARKCFYLQVFNDHLTFGGIVLSKKWKK